MPSNIPARNLELTAIAKTIVEQVEQSTEAYPPFFNNYLTIKQFGTGTCKLSAAYARHFEQVHRVELPAIVTDIALHFGESVLAFHLLDGSKSAFLQPVYMMQEELFEAVVRAGADPLVPERFKEDYTPFFDPAKNTFFDPVLQKTYEQLGSDSNRLMAKVLPTCQQVEIGLNGTAHGKLVSTYVGDRLVTIAGTAHYQPFFSENLFDSSFEELYVSYLDLLLRNFREKLDGR